MALTFTTVKRINAKYSGGFRMGIVDITLDNSYPTGGWPITAANLGFRTAIYAVIPVGRGVSGGRLFEWDVTNSKLWARESGGAAAVMAEIGAAEADTQVVRCLVIGA